jgi:hypothetical protein
MRVEAGARGEPVTSLLRQRVDLQDLDFAIDHGQLAGVVQPRPNGPGGGQVLPVGLSVGAATSSASPSQSQDSDASYGAPSAKALANQTSMSWVSRYSLSRRRLSAGAGVGTHQSSGRAAKSRLAFLYHPIPEMGCFHLPFISFKALSCVASPFATTSFRCLSCAFTTSSAVFPWCGNSHGPPNCLHVIVFTSRAPFIVCRRQLGPTCRAGRRVDRIAAHPAISDVVADLEAERVAIEGQGCVRVVMREEGVVNGWS